MKYQIYDHHNRKFSQHLNSQEEAELELEIVGKEYPNLKFRILPLTIQDRLDDLSDAMEDLDPDNKDWAKNITKCLKDAVEILTDWKKNDKH